MKQTQLLLIHGYPFDHTMWFSTIAALGSNARVIAPDLPGFGKTPVLLNRKPSMEAMADYLAEILDANDQDNVVLAGMSMGGYVALAFAEKYPRRLRGLGLISSQAADDSPETRQARAETIKRIRASGVQAALETVLPKLFSDEKGKNPELTKYPMEGAHAAGVEGLCWALQAMAARPDRTAFLRSLRIPVLIVHGSADKIVPAAKARELAESCQNPILVELRGVGHASPLEAPDQVASALSRLVQVCAEQERIERTLQDQAETDSAHDAARHVS